MIYAVHTDKGTVKKMNQDSALVKKAATEHGDILFAVVCDGMGGLSYGELASAETVEALQEWFSADLPCIAAEGLSTGKLKRSLNDRIIAEDETITEFSKKFEDCGTTLTGIFLCAGRFLCVNVGDSRVYRIRGERIELLTHDHSAVQDMIDREEITEDQICTLLLRDHPAVMDMINKGMVTEKQAKAYKMRSVLTQCIGVEGDVVPAYTEGTYEKDDIFLLCSDGFRHKLTPREIVGFFPLREMRNEKRIKRCAVRAVEENIRRGEKDNITVRAIRT